MTSELTESAVRHVASLARLRVADHELALYAQQLRQILSYVEQLNELDTDDVAITAHPLPLHNVFREDEECPSWTPQRALSAAPREQDGFFKVPRVLDQESP